MRKALSIISSIALALSLMLGNASPVLGQACECPGGLRIIQAGDLTQGAADGLYWNISGDTATGGTHDFTGGALLAAVAAAANEVMTQGASDARYPQLATVNTFTEAAIFDGDVTLGDGAEDTVTSNAGTFFLGLNSILQGRGTTTVKGTTWDLATNVSFVTVPNASAATGAMNQQTSDARYAELSGHVITGSHIVTGVSTLENLNVNGITVLGNATLDRIDFKAGTLRSINPLTWDIDAATTFDATGQSPVMKAILWDFTGSTNVTVPDADAATEAINQQVGDARYELAVVDSIEIVFSGNTFSNFSTTNTTYTTAAAFRFGGTTDRGTPTSIKFIGFKDVSPTAWDARVFDITNSLLIAEVTGSTGTASELVTDGTLTNLPAAEAIWEVQIKRTGGTGGSEAHVNAASILF